MVFWVGLSAVSWGQITVSSSTIWTTPPIGYELGITVNSGVTLTITGGTYDMNSGSSINLSSGSHLIASNATFQVSGLGSNSWQGITATGNGSIEQFSTLPDITTKGSNSAWEGVLDLSQTIVELTDINILNATTGVTSNSGAVVRTKGGAFTNCKVGVKLNSYESILNPKVNACYFQGTTFEWDGNYNALSGTFQPSDLKGIWLNGVRSVNIGGCVFQNTNPSKFCKDGRGTGIYAYHSSFTAEYEGDQFCTDGVCDMDNNKGQNCLSSGGSNPCEFTKLSRGIYFEGYGLNSIIVCTFISRYNVFTDNLVSINVQNSNSAGLYTNSFTTTRSNLDGIFTSSGCSSGNEYYALSTVLNDVKTTNAKQLKIVGNTFTANLDYVEHLEIDNAYSAGNMSLIKGNTFSSTTSGYTSLDDVMGIVFLNDNRSVNIICNTFSNQGIDIFNTTSSTLDPIPIGTKTNANNIHSGSLAGRYNLFNDGTWITNISGNNYIKSPAIFVSRSGTSLPTIGNNSTDPNCNVACDDFLADVVQISSTTEFSLIPNPTSSSFALDLANNQFTGPLDLRVISARGEEVMNTSYIAESKTLIDISDLPSGLYHVIVFSSKNNKRAVSKLVVIK